LHQHYLLIRHMAYHYLPGTITWLCLVAPPKHLSKMPFLGGALNTGSPQHGFSQTPCRSDSNNGCCIAATWTAERTLVCIVQAQGAESAGLLSLCDQPASACKSASMCQPWNILYSSRASNRLYLAPDKACSIARC